MIVRQDAGFDDRFRRLWRFYLAYCEAGFRSGRTDVIQMTLQRGSIERREQPRFWTDGGVL